LEDVLAVTGGVSQSVLTDMVGVLYEEEITEALRLLDLMIENGKDPTRFVFDMIYFLRDLLFYKTAPELADVLEIAIIDEEFKENTNNLEDEKIDEAIMKIYYLYNKIILTNSMNIV